MSGVKGQPGGRRKPSSVKKANGTYRPSRAAKNEVSFKVTRLRPPLHVQADELAVAEWKRIVPCLDEVRVLTDPDLLALANYCMTASVAIRAAIEVTKAPLVRRTRGGGAVNPHIKIAREARGECLRFAIEFGLTPAARSRIVGQPPKKDKDDAEEFLFHPPSLQLVKAK